MLSFLSLSLILQVASSQPPPVKPQACPQVTDSQRSSGKALVCFEVSLEKPAQDDQRYIQIRLSGRSSPDYIKGGNWTYVKPGEYKLRIIVDNDKNEYVPAEGKIDLSNGDLFKIVLKLKRKVNNNPNVDLASADSKAAKTMRGGKGSTASNTTRKEETKGGADTNRLAGRSIPSPANPRENNGAETHSPTSPTSGAKVKALKGKGSRQAQPKEGKANQANEKSEGPESQGGAGGGAEDSDGVDEEAGDQSETSSNNAAPNSPGQQLLSTEDSNGSSSSAVTQGVSVGKPTTQKEPSKPLNSTILISSAVTTIVSIVGIRFSEGTTENVFGAVTAVAGALTVYGIATNIQHKLEENERGRSKNYQSSGQTGMSQALSIPTKASLSFQFSF